MRLAVRRPDNDVPVATLEALSLDLAHRRVVGRIAPMALLGNLRRRVSNGTPVDL